MSHTAFAGKLHTKDSCHETAQWDRLFLKLREGGESGEGGVGETMQSSGDGRVSNSLVGIFV